MLRAVVSADPTDTPLLLRDAGTRLSRSSGQNIHSASQPPTNAVFKPSVTRAETATTVIGDLD